MTDRTIFHIDINHCYAQIEEMKYPSLRKIPMAVGGHEETRHGIILAKNDLAKKAGVLTGESLRDAKASCPDLLIIPPEYDDYIYYTNLVKEICRQYSSHIEPFGLDESWVDYTDSISLYGDPVSVAKTIQERILKEVGLTVSIGVSYNKIFAKFGSDLIKPSGLTVITRENYQELVWPRPVEDLLFVGPATKRKCKERGISTIGDLAQYPVSYLKQAMGVAGEVIWQFANGLDESDVAPSFFSTPVKSVGNSMTAVHDLKSWEELKLMYWVLCECVATRLKKCGMKGSVLHIFLRSSGLDWCGCQKKMPEPTNLSEVILEEAMNLAQSRYSFELPLRAVGVSVSGLTPDNGLHQVNLFVSEERYYKQQRTDEAMDAIREKYGFYAIRRACTLLDQPLTQFNPREEHTVHPIGYFQGRKML